MLCFTPRSPFLWGKLPTPSVSQARRLLSRLRSVRPSFGESYRRRAFRRRGRLLSRLRSVRPSAVAWLRSVRPSSKEITIVERFAGEDACAPGCAAFALRRLPGCAAFTLPGVSQARRLRSLRCKAPSAIAWLRCVAFDEWGIKNAPVASGAAGAFRKYKSQGTKIL